MSSVTGKVPQGGDSPAEMLRESRGFLKAKPCHRLYAQLLRRRILRLLFHHQCLLLSRVVVVDIVAANIDRHVDKLTCKLTLERSGVSLQEDKGVGIRGSLRK